MRYTRWEGLTAVLLAVIVVGTAYEAAIAVGWIPIGSAPGEEAGGQALVLPATGLAMLVGIAVAIFSAGRNRIVAALAPATAAFMVARFYGFDPYYAPSLLRPSETGGISPLWVWTLVVVSLMVAAITLREPRLGFLNAPVMFLCAVTAMFVDIGH
jgi:hypothetical protein